MKGLLKQTLDTDYLKAKKITLTPNGVHFKTDKEKVINNIAKYNNIQMSKKILLNSAYGALANQYFLYYSPKQAEAITMSGQLSIQWIEKDINIYINKLLNTEDIDYVIAIDTASIYVSFDKLVDELFTI